jgi:ATP-dependent Lon protease
MIKEIIIPNKNEHDLDEIPEEIKKNITYIPVNNYEEIYKKIFG